jgi:cob(I)alamin adenosyltransferase
MVNLTRIYTRTGDDGTTSLGDLTRTPKSDPRLAAYADVDETNSAIGVAWAVGGDQLAPDIREALLRTQNDLYDVGADLCTPVKPDPDKPPLRVTPAYIEELEQACDLFNDKLEPLHSFVLPGGTPAGAHLHLARTIARRAERTVWAAIEHYGTDDSGINLATAQYLNRLSDLLFILARYANQGVGEVWTPGGGRA